MAGDWTPAQCDWVVTTAINPPAWLIHDGEECRGGKLVAEVEDFGGEGHRHARLMAEAPKLYAALEAFFAAWNSCHFEGSSKRAEAGRASFFAQARAALARARGEAEVRDGQ